jgi:hypothetical protein
MSLITVDEARAWGEKTKLAPAWKDGLDADLLSQIQAEVLGNIAAVADISAWTDSATTPTMVKTIIAKMYVAWLIDRQYSEDEDLSGYAALLRTSATSLMLSITSSEIDIPGVTTGNDAGDGLPGGYPLDNSTDRDGNPYGPFFTMDAVF